MSGWRPHIPLILLVLGLLIRLSLPCLLPGDPFRGDGADYLRYAWNLKEHGVFSGEFGEDPQPTFRRMPGVPSLGWLGLVTAGQDSPWVIWPNILLACLGFFLIWKVMREWDAPEKLKWFSFGLWALVPVPEFYAVQLYPTVPALFFLSLLTWASYRYFRDRKGAFANVQALAIGLGMLFRPELALFALPFAWQAVRQKSWAKLGRFVLLIALVLAPWTLRNYLVSGTWTPLGGNLLTDPPSSRVEQGSCGRGIYDWLGTWHFKESHTKQGAWYFMDTPVEDLPAYAFGTETEKQMIREIKSSGEYTCRDDAKLQEIARARREAHPLRHYLILPLRRCFFLLFRTERTDQFRPAGWPDGLAGMAWLALALFTGAVHALAIWALLNWKRLPEWLRILGAGILLRLAFFAWFYHVEYRYMLICFPIFLLLAVAGLARIPFLRRLGA